MRRAPVVLLGVFLALLIASYVLYTRSVVLQLRRDAARLGLMTARVYNALTDTSATASTNALFDLSQHIRQLGVPVIVTDAEGRPTATANLPFEAPPNDPKVRAYVAVLDRENVPAAAQGLGTIHYGDSRLVTQLRYIPVIQALLLAIVLGIAGWMLRLRGRADREHVWAGMARESAHQLATPLSSLSGWVELMEESADDPVTRNAVRHMTGDLERLQRVAHRFERIGRPPRREPVDISDLVARIAAYFQARVPTLAHRVTVAASCGDGPLIIEGDPVLLEWALEALAKNAIDALAGRGGRLDLHAERASPDEVRLRVSDDGPGIPRELRARIFEPGFSTKETGWGIGLSLARRIVEENHKGRLLLVPSDGGATFDVILPG